MWLAFKRKSNCSSALSTPPNLPSGFSAIKKSPKKTFPSSSLNREKTRITYELLLSKTFETRIMDSTPLKVFYWLGLGLAKFVLQENCWKNILAIDRGQIFWGHYSSSSVKITVVDLSREFVPYLRVNTWGREVHPNTFSVSGERVSCSLLAPFPFVSKVRDAEGPRGGIARWFIEKN